MTPTPPPLDCGSTTSVVSGCMPQTDVASFVSATVGSVQADLLIFALIVVGLVGLIYLVLLAYRPR